MAAITTNANSLKGYKVNITSPADGDVLTYVAANGDIENKAASGGGGGTVDLTKLRYWSLEPDANSAFHFKSGAGTTLSQSQGFSVQTSSGDSSASYQLNTNQMSNILGTSFYDSTLVGRAFIRMRPPATATFSVNFGATGLSTTSADISKGIGIRSDGTNLLARNANNTAETTTNISSSFVADSYENHLVQIVHTPATNDKFYIDGTLVATNTTNLPSGTTSSGAPPWVSVRMATSSLAANLILGQISLWQQLP